MLYKIVEISPNRIVINKNGEETGYMFNKFDVAKNTVMIYKNGQGRPLKEFLVQNASGGVSRFDPAKMRDIFDNYTFDPEANSGEISGGGHYRRYSRKNIKKSAKRRVKSAKRASKSRKYRRQSK